MAKTFTIDDVIRRAAVKSACSEDQARQVITAGFWLLHKHGEPSAVRAVFDRLPGAAAVAGSTAAVRRKPGLLAGLIKATNGLPLAVVADGAALLIRFKAAGIERVTAKRVTRSVRHQVEVETGHDLVGDALRTIPGVGDMLGS